MMDLSVFSQKIKTPRLSLFITILVLAILATILSFWQIFISPKKEELIKPAPTPIPTPGFQEKPISETGDSQAEIMKKLKKDYPLWDYVPYITPDITLDYLEPLHLKVLLKKDSPEAREEVLSWIRSKGVDPKTHTIDWGTKP